LFKKVIVAVSAFKSDTFIRSAFAVDKFRFANFNVGTFKIEKVALDAKRFIMDALDAFTRLEFMREELVI
jgi:hypothetical protein